jgi:hypothetical protein
MVAGYIKNNPVNITILISMIILVWTSANLYWGDDRWNRFVKDDGSGYYAYLPAVFIYQDLSFGFYEDFRNDPERPNLWYDYRVDYKGCKINKYYAGTSLTLAPFYLTGHLLNYLYGHPLDGYSVWYLIMANVGTLFYILMGMILLVWILREFSISEQTISLVLIATVFGTNLLHYTVTEPSMSHLYSFAFVNLFVFGFLKFFKTPSSRYLLIGTLGLGIVTLIRPVNIMVILSLPFLAGSVSTFKDGFTFLFRKPVVLIYSAMAFFVITGIQLVIYKIQTGDFFVYSYRDEGFNFLRPHFIDFLVSYKKGFFVYTPMAFLALFGIYYIYRENRFRSISLVLFYLLVVYVLSSWYMWYYGGGFSQRPMVEYLVYFMIPLAILIERSNYKWIVKGLTIALVVVCLIQTIQYRNGYIHWSDMNKELYWNNFLRIDKVINKAEKEW